jgi:hypothetical protein
MRKKCFIVHHHVRLLNGEQKSLGFWNITCFNWLKVYRRFGGACCLHFQVRNVSQTRNQHEAISIVTDRGVCIYLYITKLSG